MQRITVGVNSRGLRVGQYHQRAKLSDADVRSMLTLRAEGFGWRRLAAIFECSKRTVRDICERRKRAEGVADFRPVVCTACLSIWRCACPRAAAGG